MHGVGSRNKLTPWHARFYPGSSTLDELGRALCPMKCLPRKELHEAWELAHVVRRRFQGGRVVDLCCGQGLLALMMLLVDDTSPRAVAVDLKLPQNHVKVNAAVTGAFPRLHGRVSYVRSTLGTMALAPDDVVVSSHACGSLTDDVFAAAVEAGARVAVLPCCHQTRWREDLAGVDDPSRAIDLDRADRLRDLGYEVWVESIPEEVSPKNRVLLAAPRAPAGTGTPGRLPDDEKHPC